MAAPKNGVSLEPKWRREAKHGWPLAVASSHDADGEQLTSIFLKTITQLMARGGERSPMIGSKAASQELQEGISIDLSSPSLK